jgi:DNA-binding LytR/AlgR family response regulator
MDLLCVVDGEIMFENNRITFVIAIDGDETVYNSIVNKDAGVIIKTPDLIVVVIDTRFILLKEGKVFVKIFLRDIISCVAEEGKIIIYRVNKEESVSYETMAVFGLQLPEDMFMRTHKGHFISKLHIIANTVVKGRGGDTSMNNEQLLNVSRKNSGAFLDWEKVIFVPLN